MLNQPATAPILDRPAEVRTAASRTWPRSQVTNRSVFLPRGRSCGPAKRSGIASRSGDEGLGSRRAFSFWAGDTVLSRPAARRACTFSGKQRAGPEGIPAEFFCAFSNATACDDAADGNATMASHTGFHSRWTHMESELGDSSLGHTTVVHHDRSELRQQRKKVGE